MDKVCIAQSSVQNDTQIPKSQIPAILAPLSIPTEKVLQISQPVLPKIYNQSREEPPVLSHALANPESLALSPKDDHACICSIFKIIATQFPWKM